MDKFLITLLLACLATLSLSMHLNKDEKCNWDCFELYQDCLFSAICNGPVGCMKCMDEYKLCFANCRKGTRVKRAYKVVLKL